MEFIQQNCVICRRRKCIAILTLRISFLHVRFVIIVKYPIVYMSFSVWCKIYLSMLIIVSFKNYFVCSFLMQNFQVLLFFFLMSFAHIIIYGKIFIFKLSRQSLINMYSQKVSSIKTMYFTFKLTIVYVKKFKSYLFLNLSNK